MLRTDFGDRSSASADRKPRLAGDGFPLKDIEKLKQVLEPRQQGQSLLFANHIRPAFPLI
jgi:hypothetical protein